jgi:L-fuculose-phosphate aldolase
LSREVAIGLIDDDFNVLEAEPGFKPSSEVKMHLRCYHD